MKHRKKKSTAKQNKQEGLHQRNEFYKKMKQMMALLGDAAAFDLLNDLDLLQLYCTRLHPYKIINPHDGQPKTNKRVLLMVNKSLSGLLHQKFIQLGEQQIQLSLYDFSVYAETLHLLWRTAPDVMQGRASEFQACFPLFNERYEDFREEAVGRILKCLAVVAWAYSDFTHSVIRFVREKTEKSDNSVFYNNYVLEQKCPETEFLELDGHKRTIYRICENINQEFIPMVITPGSPGPEGVEQKSPLRVFIQKHALDRLKERLGNRFMYLCYYRVINTILEDSIPTDNNNSYLFPLIVDQLKLGYLKGVVVGDRLVILTFLFLTNNGTPEGKKLHRLIGLQKEDKKYLGIDKLSTFVLSDIQENEKLKALFCEAGCGDLFKVDKTFLDQPDKKEFAIAEFLVHYLGMDQTNIFPEFTEAD
jgi:hypothetical protein